MITAKISATHTRSGCELGPELVSLSQIPSSSLLHPTHWCSIIHCHWLPGWPRRLGGGGGWGGYASPSHLAVFLRQQGEGGGGVGERVINLLPNSMQEVHEVALSLSLITPLLCQVYIQFSLCLITSQHQLSIHLPASVLRVPSNHREHASLSQLLKRN